MSLSQPGASYRFREHIKDQYVKGAFDDVASQIQAITNQGNFGKQGVATPPTPPAVLNVSLQNGVYTAIISHPSAPPGTRWMLEYSTTPNFVTKVPVDLGEATQWQAYLPFPALYFRVSARTLTSAPSAHTYFGTSSQPQLPS